MNPQLAKIAAIATAVVGFGSVTTVAVAQDQTSVTVQAAATAPAPQARAQKANRDVLSRADLEAKPSANLHDVVSSMRSHWLRGSASARPNLSITTRETSGGGFMQAPDATPRTGVGAASGATTQVYVDGRRFGALASLRSMPAETVEKVCYFPLNRAQNRFGLAVEAPVIEVFTRSSSYAETSC